MNLLNEMGENLLSVYDDGYERGIDDVIRLLEKVNLDSNEKFKINEIIEYIKENR